MSATKEETRRASERTQNILLLEKNGATGFYSKIAPALESENVTLTLAYGIDDFKHRFHREAFDLAIVQPNTEDELDLPSLLKTLKSNLDPRRFFPIILLLHPEDTEEYEPKIPQLIALGVTAVLRSSLTVVEQKSLLLSSLLCKSNHNYAAECAAKLNEHYEFLKQLLNQESPDYQRLSATTNVQLDGRLEHTEFYAGDLIQIFPAADHQLLIVLMNSQATSTQALCSNLSVSGMIEGLFVQHPETPLGAMLTALNTAYCRKLHDRDLSMVALYKWNTTSRNLEYASAGFPLGWVQSVSKENLAPLEAKTSGPPLGVDCDLQYRSTSITLAPKDQLILMTNGMWDQKLADSTVLNLEAVEGILRATVACSPDEKISAAFEHLYAKLGSKQLNDDAGMFILSV